MLYISNFLKTDQSREIKLYLEQKFIKKYIRIYDRIGYISNITIL